MSCRTNRGSSAITSYARASSGLSDAQNLSLFHKLLREGATRNEPAPPPEVVQEWLATFSRELAANDSINPAQRQSILARLQNLDGTALPDGAMFYAWRENGEASQVLAQTIDRGYANIAADLGTTPQQLRERVRQLERDFQAGTNHRSRGGSEHTAQVLDRFWHRVRGAANEVDSSNSSNNGNNTPHTTPRERAYLLLPTDPTTIAVWNTLLDQADISARTRSNSFENSSAPDQNLSPNLVAADDEAAATANPIPAANTVSTPPETAASQNSDTEAISTPLRIEVFRPEGNSRRISAEDFKIIGHYAYESDCELGCGVHDMYIAIDLRPGADPNALVEIDALTTIVPMAMSGYQQNLDFDIYLTEEYNPGDHLNICRQQGRCPRCGQFLPSDSAANSHTCPSLPTSFNRPGPETETNEAQTDNSNLLREGARTQANEEAVAVDGEIAAPNAAGSDAPNSNPSEFLSPSPPLPSTAASTSPARPSLPPPPANQVYSQIYETPLLPEGVTYQTNPTTPGSVYEFQPLSRALRSNRGEVTAFNVLRQRWEQGRIRTAAGEEEDNVEGYDNYQQNYLNGLSRSETDQLYDLMRRRLYTQAQRLDEARITVAAILSNSQQANSSNLDLTDLTHQLEEYQKRRLEWKALQQDRLDKGWPVAADPDGDETAGGGSGKDADAFLDRTFSRLRSRSGSRGGNNGSNAQLSSALLTTNEVGLRWDNPTSEPVYTLPDYSAVADSASISNSDGAAAEPLYFQVKRGTGAGLRENIIRSGLPIVVVEGHHRTGELNPTNQSAIPDGAIVLNWGAAGSAATDSNHVATATTDTISSSMETAALPNPSATPPPTYFTLNTPTAVARTRDKLTSLENLAELAPRSTTDPRLAVANFGAAFVAKKRIGQGGSGTAILQNPPSSLAENRPLGNLPTLTANQYDIFQEYLPNRKEYRALVLGGEVIALYEKKPLTVEDASVPSAASNEVASNGGASDNATPNPRPQAGFEFVSQATISQRQLQASQQAMERLDLDFGGVDLVYDTDTDRLMVLEVNSAPGLGVESLKRLFGAVQNQLQRANADEMAATTEGEGVAI